MALHYNYKECNLDGVSDQVITEMIYCTMVIEIGHFTEKNIKEVFYRISIAEKHVKSLGIDQVRVRHHGNLARIEVPKEQISILMNEDNNRKITENLKKLGYVYVTVDLQGFRSGSMNDQLIKNTFS